MTAVIHEHNIRLRTPPVLRLPVPRVFVLCEDVGVIRTPLYISSVVSSLTFLMHRVPELWSEWCVVLSLLFPSSVPHGLLQHARVRIQLQPFFRGPHARLTLLA